MAMNQEPHEDKPSPPDGGEPGDRPARGLSSPAPGDEPGPPSYRELIDNINQSAAPHPDEPDAPAAAGGLPAQASDNLSDSLTEALDDLEQLLGTGQGSASSPPAPLDGPGDTGAGEQAIEDNPSGEPDSTSPPGPPSPPSPEERFLAAQYSIPLLDDIVLPGSVPGSTGGPFEAGTGDGAAETPEGPAASSGSDEHPAQPDAPDPLAPPAPFSGEGRPDRPEQAPTLAPPGPDGFPPGAPTPERISLPPEDFDDASDADEDEFDIPPPPSPDPMAERLAERLASEVEVIVDTRAREAMLAGLSEIKEEVRRHIKIVLPDILDELAQKNTDKE